MQSKINTEPKFAHSLFQQRHQGNIRGNPEVPNQKQIKSHAYHSHGTPHHLLFACQTEAATHSQRLSVRPCELPILLVSNSHTEKNTASAKPNKSPTTSPKFLCFKARLTRALGNPQGPSNQLLAEAGFYITEVGQMLNSKKAISYAGRQKLK